MSGLQSYYNAVNNFSTNLETAQSYLDNYDSKFYDDFNNKVNEIKEQGKALLEAGGTLEGVYAGGKAVQASIKAYRAKYSKNDGDEDGDGKPDADEEEDDPLDIDENDPELNDLFGGDGGAQGGGQVGADVAEGAEDDAEDLASQARQFLGGFQGESGSGGSVPLDDLGADASADVGQTGGTTLSRVPDIDLDADPFQPTAGQQVRPTEFGGQDPNAPIQMEDINQTAPQGRPTQLSQDPNATQESQGGTQAEAEDIGDVNTAPTQGGVVDTAVETGAETGAEVGTDVATDVGSGIGDALLAGAGIASEAIPVVGGLVAIGIGLYDLFHHHSKPKPPPPPTNTVSQKGEMVVPSFDSVTDTPASQSAF